MKWGGWGLGRAWLCALAGDFAGGVKGDGLGVWGSFEWNGDGGGA